MKQLPLMLQTDDLAARGIVIVKLRGRSAVPETTVRQVVRLAEAGWAQSAIAAELSIGRTTVYRILAGKHVSARQKTHVRCSQCGAMVAGSCTACSQAV